MSNKIQNVDMSLENNIIIRISKKDASTKQEANKIAKEQLENNAQLVISDRLKMVRASLQTGEASVDIGIVEEYTNHFMVAANYIITFDFDMKGEENSIANRSENMIKTNAYIDYNRLDVDVLAKHSQFLASTEVPEELISLNSEESMAY